MDHANRLIVWSIVALVAIYDLLCHRFGWPTISAGVRSIDVSLGGLPRWAWLALWAHFFVRSPWGGW